VNFVWRSFVALTGLTMALIGTVGSAAASDMMFRTPSGAIGCGYFASTLRCDVGGGVIPSPPRPRDCDLDWRGGFYLKAHGRATVVCAGDTALNPSAQVVRYGGTWRQGGIACSSSPNGFRCTDADGHGFLICRGESYRF
jgi:hypothetical protein